MSVFGAKYYNRDKKKIPLSKSLRDQSKYEGHDLGLIQIWTQQNAFNVLSDKI